jgi:hypothetical protein
MREKMRAAQEILKEEILAKLEAHRVMIMARMYFQLEEMEEYVEKTEATNLEENPEELQSEAVQEVVPK